MTRWQARDPSRFRTLMFVLLPVIILLLLASSYIPTIQNGWKALLHAAKLVPFAESFSNDGLKIHVLDVGKADAILIETEENAVLVDSATHEQSGKIRDYLESRDITGLDALVLSHGDSDHIGGADELLRDIPVGEILCSAYSTVTDSFPTAVCMRTGDVREYGDLFLEILGPETKFETENDNSLVFRLHYGDFTMIFCGDIESDAENALLISGQDLRADVLKAAHHGSNTSSSTAFLSAVSPKYAVISVGEDTSLLPRNAVLKRMSDAGIEFFRTDKQGTVVLSVDGEDIIINTERDSYEKNDY